MTNKKFRGMFSNIFDISPRNRILEFFLEGRELDFSIGDVSREIKLNRATTYNTMKKLIKEKYVIPTRKVSGGQLYKLNQDKKEVKILIETLNLIFKEYIENFKVER